MVLSFRDLKAWQEAMRLAEMVYALAARLPGTERFALAVQIRRACVSIPSNIAEGHARGATRDFARFVSVARGSLAELETQLELIERLNLASLHPMAPLKARCDELGRLLRGLRKSLDKKLAAARH